MIIRNPLDLHHTLILISKFPSTVAGLQEYATKVPVAETSHSVFFPRQLKSILLVENSFLELRDLNKLSKEDFHKFVDFILMKKTK